MQPNRVIPGTSLPRIMKDIKTLQNREKEGIYMKIVNDDVSKIYIMLVGADKTPYHNGLFFFTIEPLANWDSRDTPLKYPANPPRVLFFSCYDGYIHENLYSREMGGKVCLSILGTWPGGKDEQWSPLMTFENILMCIYQIMDLESSSSYSGYKTHLSPKALKAKIPREVVKFVYEPILAGKSVNFTVGQETMNFNIFDAEIKALWASKQDWYKEQLAVKP